MNRSLEYEFQMEDIKTKNDKNIKSKIILSQNEIDKFSRYNIEDYQYDIEILGLEKTWNLICEYILLFGENENFLNINNFGEMYEIGLAIRDKHQKKTSGQYYTPDDVAKVMAKWLIKSDGINVCDVGCGTGKLILTYLDLIGYENARNIIKKGNLYLYDFDNIALKICKTSIALKYGIDIMNNINDINCDFLNEKIILPQDSKVISNPPYSIIHEIKEEWDKTQVLLETKELYSSFMEKIFLQSKSVVIITPFSFISSKKFFSLRKLMCSTGNGFIVSFDNVPGNIFYGRKHGIFNSNTTNSVRASITFFQKSSNYYGFRLSPLIRFKQTERENLLNNEILESYISKKIKLLIKTIKCFLNVIKNLKTFLSNEKKCLRIKLYQILLMLMVNMLFICPIHVVILHLHLMKEWKEEAKLF